MHCYLKYGGSILNTTRKLKPSSDNLHLASKAFENIARIKTRVSYAAGDFSPSLAGNHSTFEESISQFDEEEYQFSDRFDFRRYHWGCILWQATVNKAWNCFVCFHHQYH